MADDVVTSQSHTLPTSFLRGGRGRDIGAGLAVGFYMIPQAMAYGVLVGVGAGPGLAMAAVPLLAYLIVGRHRLLSLGPEVATAMMATGAVAPIAARYHVPIGAALGATSLLVTVALALAWVFKAGFLADLLSKPVLLGYLTGVAVVMVLGELGQLTGSTLDGSSLSKVWSTAPHAHINPLAVAVGLGTAGIIWLLGKKVPRLPAALVALGLAIVIGYTTGVPTIGSVDERWQAPQLGSLPLSMLGDLVVVAISVAIIAYTNVMLTARAFSEGERVDANRELGALTVAMLATGLSGGYPISASNTRSAIARMSGAVSRNYTWTVAAVVVVAPLVAGSVLAHVPQAALAGIIVYSAVILVDVPSWTSVLRLRASEAWSGVACAVAVVLLGIEPGIVIAVAFSVVELIKRLSRPHDAILGFVPGMPGMHDVDDYPEATQLPGLVVFRYDAPLFFGNANDFYTKTLDAAAADDVHWLVLNMEASVEVDSTGLDALGEIVTVLRDRGVHVALARVKNDLLIPMRRYGTARLIGETNMYPTLPAAVLAYKRDPDSPKVKIPNRKLKSADPLRSAEPLEATLRKHSRRNLGRRQYFSRQVANPPDRTVHLDLALGHDASPAAQGGSTINADPERN